MLVSGKNQPTLDLPTTVTRLECCRKKVVKLEQIPSVEYKDKQIPKERQEKIEKAIEGCLAWANLSRATAFMEALETLDCLQEKSSGEDIKDRHLTSKPDEWKCLVGTWAEIQDPQNREQREWKAALLVLNKALQPYGCNLTRLRRGFENKGLAAFLLACLVLFWLALGAG